MCALVDESEPPAPKESAAKAPPAREGAQNRTGAQAADGTDKAAPLPPKQADAQNAPPYDDEAVADVNYFAFADAEAEKEDTHAQAGGAHGKAQTDGRNAGADEDAQSLFSRTGSEDVRTDEGACYYDKVKADLDALFLQHPAEEELAKSIPLSRWAKIAFGEGKHYAVGIIRDETHVKYICYGVPSERRGEPPEPLRRWCSYLPLSVFDLNGKGYWMMFQDAVTGACVKLEQA